MPYIYAQSTFERINGDAVTIKLIHNIAGADTSVTFDVDPVGYTLEYVGEDDKHLRPGIMGSKCTINTIWDNTTYLNTLITLMTIAEEGEWIIQMFAGSSSDPFWTGVIISEQFEILESSEIQTCKIVATDGLAMLKQVKYNDNGDPYLDYTQLLGYVRNIHTKWILYDYMLNQYASSLLPRFKISDDVVSTDQDNYTTHPSGTNMRVWQKTRLHNKTFYNKNEAGVNQYRSCWDILESFCLTFQMRMYAWGSYWAFVPVALSDSDLTGYTERWNSVIIDDTQTVDAWSFQTDDIQKGASWVKTLTAPAHKVQLTRNTEGIYSLLDLGSSYDWSVVTSPLYNYLGLDTLGDTEIRYKVSGRIALTWTGDATLSGNNILGRIVLRFLWTWNTSNGQYISVIREVSPSPFGATGSYIGINQDLNNLDYTPFYVSNDESNLNATGTQGFYDKHSIGSDYYYNAKVDGSQYVDFNFFMDSPSIACDDFDFQIQVRTYDYEATYNSSLQSDMSESLVWAKVEQVQADEAVQLASFDYIATTETGRDSIDLGQTYIGDFGVGDLMGGIEVYNGTSYAVSGNWVSQAQSSARLINQLAVEELLAMHKYSRFLERGLIIANDVTSYPRPFDRFNDSDTGFYYAPIAWKQYGTMIEHDVTLFKVGRNFNDVNFESDENNATRRDGGGGYQTDSGSAPSGKPESVYQNFNQDATDIHSAWNTSTVGGGATLEMYYTVSTNGQGRYIDDQGQDPPTDYEIERTIYVVDEALADHTDSGWQTPSALQPVADAPTGVRLAKCWDAINAYMSKLNAPCYSFAVMYNEVFVGQLLDTYQDAVVGYSLRRLRTAYTGNAITVRRTVNPASQDIGFDSEGNLDTTALLAFCGAGDGNVTKWYDQWGSNDLIQTTTANQPQIVNAGTVRTLNGKPALFFDGSNDSLGLTSLSPNPGGHFTMACVFSMRAVGSLAQFVVNSWASSTSSQNFQAAILNTGVGRVGYRYTGGAFPRNDTASAISTGTQYILTAHYARDEADAYWSGTYRGDQYSQNISSTDPNNVTQGFRVGARSYDLALPLDGMVQEVVLWSQQNHDHDASEISDTINGYYSAY